MSGGIQAGRRCGFVAVIGAPNAGKSTLVNALVGGKVSIVTHKVQTTRMQVRGVALCGSTQIVFIDTPGIFAPRRRLDRAMVEAAWSGAAAADLVVLVVDAPLYAEARLRGASSNQARLSADDTERIIDGLEEAGRKAILVLNKIDSIGREKLLAVTAKLNERPVFTDTFMISALTGDGVDDVKRAVAARLPEGPWLYPEDQLADLPQRLLAAELTREKLTLRLHDELPYQSTVETESWKDFKDGSVRIEQVITVARQSQKPIVLGRKGQTIREIGAAARAEMEAVFGRRVHLFLFVKVREGWADDPARFRELGLDYPKT